MKVAVITPYYREADEILRRCLDSVAAQTHVDLVHYLVADGFPRPDLLANRPRVASIQLPFSHGDFGNTPRAVGALSALNSGADVVCFLDADNLYLPQHVASLVQVYEAFVARGEACDAVIASRHIFLPGHEHLRLVDPEDESGRHIDTNCMSLARSAAFLWVQWGLIPQGWACIGDRVMYDLMRTHRLKVAKTGLFTTLYESNWSVHYKQAGLPVPTTGLHDLGMARLSQPSQEEIAARLLLRPAKA